MFGSSSRVRTEAELAEKLKQGASEIFIEGSLTEKVIRILGVFIPPVFPVAGGGLHFVVGAANFVRAVGMRAAMSAVVIVKVAGNVRVLDTLRSYKIVEKSDSRLVLKKNWWTIINHSHNT